MKPLIGLVTLVFATSAFAQVAPPKVGDKPLVQIKPKAAAAGCKLVGTVEGTKIWAGDCADAAEIRGSSPAAEAAPATPLDRAVGAIPPGQK